MPTYKGVPDDNRTIPFPPGNGSQAAEIWEAAEDPVVRNPVGTRKAQITYTGLANTPIVVEGVNAEIQPSEHH